MAAVTAAVAVGAGTAYMSKRSADKAARASQKGVDASVASQNRALDYQMEMEALPAAYRDAAMQGLGTEYGLTLDQNGNVIGDGTTITDRVLENPLYQNALTQGNQNVGRMASATGGLRSGASNNAFYRNAQDAFQNAYLQQLQGLSGFARTPLNTNGIAGTMTNIGNTQAQGAIAQGQIAQNEQQGYINALGMGLNAYNTFV